MTFDKNVSGAELNDLFDCRGKEISPRNENTAVESCPLAMVYPVKQVFKNLYEPGAGLARGTLFAELDLPFTASEGGKRC